MTIKLGLKLFSGVALVFLVFLALGSASWQPRSGLGWEIAHFVGYFVFTLLAVSWARGALAAKNKLAALDARRVDDAFEQAVGVAQVSHADDADDADARCRV